ATKLVAFGLLMFPVQANASPPPRATLTKDRVFLMTKGCTHGGDKALAMKMLEESLRRLQSDRHLDLWQIHGVVFENDPDLFIRGFSGHKDPNVHLKMLQTRFP